MSEESICEYYELFWTNMKYCSHSYTEYMKYSKILFSCSYKLAQQKLEGVQNLQLAFQLEHLGAGWDCFYAQKTFRGDKF
jgi:hypothetical protein